MYVHIYTYIPCFYQSLNPQLIIKCMFFSIKNRTLLKITHIYLRVQNVEEAKPQYVRLDFISMIYIIFFTCITAGNLDYREWLASSINIYRLRQIFKNKIYIYTVYMYRVKLIWCLVQQSLFFYANHPMLRQAEM